MRTFRNYSMFIKNYTYKRDTSEVLLGTTENAETHNPRAELLDKHYIQGLICISYYQALTSFRNDSSEFSYKTEGVLDCD